MITVSDKELLEKYLRDAKDFEGKSPCLYLDADNNPSIGIGHKVANKTKYLSESDLAPFIKFMFFQGKVLTNSQADVKLINEDYKKLLNGEFGTFNSKLWKSTSSERPYLGDAGIYQIFLDNAQAKLLTLKISIEGFSEFPLPIQLTLLDIAFNSGAGYLTGKLDKIHKHYTINKKYFVPIRKAISNQNWKNLSSEVEKLDDFLWDRAPHWISKARYKGRKRWLQEAIHYQNSIAKQIHPFGFYGCSRFLDNLPLNIFQCEEFSNLCLNPREPYFLGAALPRTSATPGSAKIPGPIGSHVQHQHARTAVAPFEAVVADVPAWKSPLLEIQTPLKEAFVVSQLTGTETLSQPFQFQVTVYARNTAIKGSELLTRKVMVKLNNPNGTTRRYFHGIIGRFIAGEAQDGWRQYVLEIVPALALLGHESDCRVFRNMTVLDIVKKLAAKPAVRIDSRFVKRHLPARDFCVQYNETDLNFIHRLLEDEGIFYYFKHTADSHVLVLADDPSGYHHEDRPVLQYTAGQAVHKGEVSRWEKQSDYYTGQFMQGDYLFTAPDSALLAKQNSRPQLKAAEKAQWYDYPGNFTQVERGKMLAQFRADAEEAWHEWVEAAGNTALSAGQVFKLAAHSDARQIGDYVVTSIQHYACDTTHHLGAPEKAAQDYFSAFKALPANVAARPRRQTYRPLIQGHQTAFVIGDGQRGQETCVDEYGRVCVRFHWEREGKGSSWVRVAQRWAGNHWGMIFNPRIGQEVIINFEEGNPDRPVIIGSVYNAQNKPPYTLPDHDTRSGIKTHSTKKGGPQQANELYFEDRKGQETIYWHAQRNFTQVIENNVKVSIQRGNQRTQIKQGKASLEAAKAIELTVGGNRLRIDTQGIFINGEQIKFAKG